MNTYDVVIIGAGVTGAAIARELSRYKLSIALLEKEAEVCFGVSKANSGVIHAGFHASPDTLKGKLCAKANAMFDQLQDELNFPFQRSGEYVVAMSDDEIPKLRLLQMQGKANGVPDLHMLNSAEVLKREPNLSHDVRQALWSPTAGVVCPFNWVYSLVDNAVHNGVHLFTEQEVIAIKSNGSLTVTTLQQEFETRFVINAAGLYADRIAEIAGVRDFDIHPRKGEEYLLDKSAGSLVKSIIFPASSPSDKSKSKGILVNPTIDGNLMIGPTATSVDDKEDVSTSSQGLNAIIRHAQTIVPRISKREIITSFAGLRPAADGEDFVIGPTKCKGFINVAGIQSPGLTAAPAIALMVVDILKDEGLSLQAKKDFHPERKRRLDISELDYSGLHKAIKQNPTYGRLVCRCEIVSEGEIIDAVKAGACTTDGVKFRTRAGMGRCQGGFCTFKTLEIMSRELGVPISDLTKKGGRSKILARLKGLLDDADEANFPQKEGG